MKVTAVIIALNEADRLVPAIRSALPVSDEVLVVDGGSKDGTPAVAQEAGARVLERPFDDFSRQKNFANAQASHPWILSLDADERVSPELAAEIQALRDASEPAVSVSAYAMPRHTYYLGRLIRHNWYPDIKPRLFHRERARWTGDFVHESLAVNGGIFQLKGAIDHYSYRDIADHVSRINHYSSRAARKAHAEGRRAGWPRIALLPAWTFFRYYLIKRGCLDGWPGFVVAVLSSYNVLLKYLKIRELNMESENAPGKSPHADPAP